MRQFYLTEKQCEKIQCALNVLAVNPLDANECQELKNLAKKFGPEPLQPEWKWHDAKDPFSNIAFCSECKTEIKVDEETQDELYNRDMAWLDCEKCHRTMVLRSR